MSLKHERDISLSLAVMKAGKKLGKVVGAHRRVRTSTGSARASHDRTSAAAPRSARGAISSGLLWLSGGVAALAVGLVPATAAHQAATVSLSTLATSFGLWVFWRDGGSRITAVGLYNFAFALFIGFAGLYLVWVRPPMIPVDQLLPAVAWAYFLQVATWLLFWSKGPWSKGSGSAGHEPPSADRRTARWGAWLGAWMLLTAVVLTAAHITFWPTTGSQVIILASGFVGVMLVGAGLLQGTARTRSACIGVAVAFAVYAYFMFNGFGRIIIGTLGFGLLLMLAQRTGGRRIKALVLVGSAPVLLSLAVFRILVIRWRYPDGAAHDTGLESVVSPLATFGALLRYNADGLLDHGLGHTFWAALVALFPRAVWSDKPMGFGAELVALIHPKLVGSGHSEAALFHGEWLFNFGLPGLLLMVPVTGLAIRWLDRFLVHTATPRLDSRRALLLYTAAVIAVIGVIDLAWVGSFSYSARTGSRLMVVAVVVALAARRVGAWAPQTTDRQPITNPKTQVLFVLDVPTPQRTPVIDAMYQRGVDLLALVHARREELRGWGSVVPQHPCVTIPSGLIRSCRFLLQHVFAPDVRVLCCIGYNRVANILAILAARLRGVQVVTRSDSNWLHERERPRLRRFVKRMVLRLLFGRRTRVWTIGIQNDRYWAEMGLPNRHLIPFEFPRPPIGTKEQGRAFRDAQQLGPGLVVLYVGMLEPHKGVDTLVTAFRSMPDPRARLVIVGRGSLGPLIREAAQADPRIIGCGPLPQQELGHAFAAADLFVLPSRQEAWGYVVNEAQANGVRVVVSDAVGCAADCVNEANGSVFRAGDANHLAELLTQAAHDHARGPLTVLRRGSYDAAPAMIADLIRLGVRLLTSDQSSGVEPITREDAGDTDDVVRRAGIPILDVDAATGGVRGMQERTDGAT